MVSNKINKHCFMKKKNLPKVCSRQSWSLASQNVYKSRILRSTHRHKVCLNQCLNDKRMADLELSVHDLYYGLRHQHKGPVLKKLLVSQEMQNINKQF